MTSEEIAINGFYQFRGEDLSSLSHNIAEEIKGLKCMQHPLGFYHFRLYAKEKVSVRLHYWPFKERPSSSAATPYHDHVWNLQSCVLTGRIENVLLTLKKDTAGPYVVAQIEQINGVDAVVPTSERVRIDSTEINSYSAGENYSMQS